MTPSTSRSPLDPMPLAARAAIGRGAGGVLAALVLLGGLVALDGTGTVPRWLIVLVVGTATATAAFVAVAPWRRWLSTTTQEALLAASLALPAIGAVVVYAADEPTDTDALLFLAAISVASALVVPLRWHVAGVLTMLAGVAVLAGARGAVREATFVLLVVLATAALAGLAAAVLGATIATGVAREQEAEAANRALLAVVDAARTATTQDAQEVLDTVVAATERLQSDLAGIYLLRPDGRLEYGATFRVPEHLQVEAYDPGEGLAGQALRENRLVLTNDYQQFAGAMDAYRQIGLRAAMGTPIRIDDEPVGVLVAGRYAPGGYDHAATTAFELLADHAGRALSLSRAIDEDRRLLERLKSLHALQEDFVATISHELRTPLTVIDGLAETLESRDLTAAQASELLSRLRANTTTLTTIVTSLLEAARLDRGLVEVEQEVVDLWSLLEASIARMSPILTEHQLQLDLDDALVVADAGLLDRVIDNLLTNAQRHTPPGTTVRIETRASGVVCTVTISDDGPGIPPEDLDRITERFTRGGELHTRSTRGLGLGLALADQILRLHGTRLVVTSPPGRGAQFQFKLRLAA